MSFCETRNIVPATQAELSRLYNSCNEARKRAIRAVRMKTDEADRLRRALEEIARLPNHSPLADCAYQGADIPKKYIREQEIFTPAFNKATEKARLIARNALLPAKS